ncbi:succinate--CoA ligase subunit alpha [Cupriavidus agavae]|uniref:Succinyl-CoA synthetase (ADP-forming) alpha subunit n=1 Tax=Cupriavidus agavae TaxID=1001822 RepID=A0A4Q7RZN0_9BURK|nr:succinate--CoA ligase subunit alpha [Cupriavidus agavae]RZT39313.1 succinyl-CoA synthetase (ADP-forming) alpha subunit [Cupriavidus agavae]
MAILIDRNTRVICQGLTGAQGTFYAGQAQVYGTKIVGGVAPGRGGMGGVDGNCHLGLPVFDTVAAAADATGADASVIVVPAPFAADAILEAIDAGLGLIVCLTEGIPVMDMVRVRRALAGSGSRLVGPNCAGVITPGQSLLGAMPGHVHSPGRIGVVSRSGTLAYEAAAQTTAAGLGQSTCVGLGDDPVSGTSLADCLELFLADDQTEAILMIGGLDGAAEEDAARLLRDSGSRKPVVAYLAGAVNAGGAEAAGAKADALRAAGMKMAASPAELGAAMVAAMR